MSLRRLRAAWKLPDHKAAIGRLEALANELLMDTETLQRDRLGQALARDADWIGVERRGGGQKRCQKRGPLSLQITAS